jgi:hypothetical protein
MTDPYVVTTSLVVLSLVDFGLAGWVFFFPGSFLRFFYETEYEDSSGLLFRTGCFWFTFGVIQGFAVIFWTKTPAFLAIVAGVRFTELIADWVYVTGPNVFTPRGRFSYFLSVPYTVTFGCLVLYNASFRLPAESIEISFLTGNIFVLGSYSVAVLLGLLVLIDFTIGTIMLWEPGYWSRIIHSGDISDEVQLLRRTAGVRFSVAVIQGWALIDWWNRPIWLLVVAGMRLSESVADWGYLARTIQTSILGRTYLAIIPVVNLAIGFTFLVSYANIW